MVLESLLQVSSNLMKLSMVFSKFVNLVFYFDLMVDIIPMYLGVIFVKKAAYMSIHIFLALSSEFLIVRL